MLKWTGAAELCLDGDGRVLMILQGAPEDDKKWSVPTAVTEDDDALEQAVKQEVKEVTGCEAQVTELVETKELAYPQAGIQLTVYYFKTELTDGMPKAPEGDELIAEVAWKTAEEIESLELMYPDERDVLIRYASTHFN
ncbi:NUDIX hydrolase [Planococcus lenghuensis]|uniref:Nudix hydrolase domain-containing protein n=1 Tax=Planococcus lenghuensis TaxID=2213202 RepID=A0A1Q2KVK9_9BACL|nr:NUDIX domain-containing protein [Planococcus lenghuensis]AQQ52231.1 hypothetical protein B0X71_03300 [Planococcus lenghuensis]